MPALSYINKQYSTNFAIDFATIVYLIIFACNNYVINCHTVWSLQLIIAELKDSRLNPNASQLHLIQKVLLKRVFKEFVVKFINSNFIVTRFVQVNCIYSQIFIISIHFSATHNFPGLIFVLKLVKVFW